MKILVIGSGGREHAIAWRLAQSPSAEKVYCAPGNPGIAAVAECVNIGVTDFDTLAAFAEAEKIDLTVVGPEVPLCEGIVDFFKARGLRTFGPSKAAAQLEGSKDAAKVFMRKYGIPTADSGTFTDAAAAKAYATKRFEAGDKATVVKADGLAAGKGVIIAESLADAFAAIDLCFSGGFGDAGRKVVIEEFLEGIETSVIALTDGTAIVPLASSQDHKRLLDLDRGPNTGGMGTCSPSPGFSPELAADINTEILTPFLDGIREEGYDYRGVIFIGLMLTSKGPKTLEFNVRFGDPETQVILTRLLGDFAQICALTADGRLAEAEIDWSDKASVCVIMAAGGYPDTYRKGDVIRGLEVAASDTVNVFHAGTARNAEGEVVTNGGRVLGVTATGSDIAQAIANAYDAVGKISWNGAIWRTDIGQKSFAD